MTFNELNLSAPVLRAVAQAGYESPSPIQAAAIPPVLAGRDLMGCAQTGTGKTAAFALPMLDRLTASTPRKKGAIRALILTPTRELALQIGESFEAYGKYLTLRSTVIFGGVGQAPQVAALKKGVDILIACPGRLNDLVGQGLLDGCTVGNVFASPSAAKMADMIRACDRGNGVLVLFGNYGGDRMNFELACETVDNRGFNLPAIPAGETDENGVPLGNDFTSDINVRRAINLAIDRDEMIEHVLNGYGTAAYSVCDQMPWYNEAAEVDYDPDMAAAILKEAGWLAGSDGILEKNGVRAEFNMLYPTGDSVRQALAEDTANQLKEIGIKVTTEGVGWDTAYDRAQSTPLMWGWGAHTPMELYNIYHTAPGKEYAEYSPYANEKVDEYMDEALAESDLEKSYELWKNAQWDGTTGITQDGDLPWIWLVNIDHLYWVKDGLQVAEQKLHPHGHGWSIVNNVDQWTWK
mgnify:CR=1 FL=1